MTRRLSWQATTALGVAHAFASRQAGSRALCTPAIRRLDDRWERETKSRCLGCLRIATEQGLMPEGQMAIGWTPPEMTVN